MRIKLIDYLETIPKIDSQKHIKLKERKQELIDKLSSSILDLEMEQKLLDEKYSKLIAKFQLELKEINRKLKLIEKYND